MATRTTNRRRKVNNPPQYTPGGPPKQPVGAGIQSHADEVPGGTNQQGLNKNQLTTGDLHKTPFEDKFKRTKSLTQREGESDKDFAARQESFKTRRGNMARRTLRSALGKNWAKRVYSGQAANREYRENTVSRFNKLRDRESGLSDKLSKATEDAQKTAIQERLDALKSKRKEVGAKVRDFRGQRREALQMAYENPRGARKEFPEHLSFQVKADRGKGKGRGSKLGGGGQSRGPRTYNPHGFPVGGKGRARFPIGRGRKRPVGRVDQNSRAPGFQPTPPRPAPKRTLRKKGRGYRTSSPTPR